MNNTSVILEPGKRELTLSRLLDAPASLVYKMWTDPEHVINWWGPEGFTNTTIEMTVQPGGKWRYIMHGPDGVDYPNRITYQEVVKNKKLVYLHGDDADDAGSLMEVTVLFEPKNGKTLLTMHSIFSSAEARDLVIEKFGALEGGKQHIDRLNNYTKGMEDWDPDAQDEIFITRIFDAPRELMFEAFSDTRHLAHWYAPAGCIIEIYEHDFREGGIFLHGIHTPGMKECMCKATYVEISKPERLVYTLSFADIKGNTIEPAVMGKPEWPAETTVTITFTEWEGKTKLTLHQTVSATLAKQTGAYPSWLSMFDNLAKEVAKTLVNVG
ncbi:MAG: SRPBCC family protein [Chitinophagaceae bacterium]